MSVVIDVPRASALDRLKQQNEIASTLGEVAQSLNSESLNAASQSLVAEAQKNRTATASAIEGLKAQVTANQ